MCGIYGFLCVVLSQLNYQTRSPWGDSPCLTVTGRKSAAERRILQHEPCFGLTLWNWADSVWLVIYLMWEDVSMFHLYWIKIPVSCGSGFGWFLVSSSSLQVKSATCPWVTVWLAMDHPRAPKKPGTVGLNGTSAELFFHKHPDCWWDTWYQISVSVLITFCILIILCRAATNN